MTQQNFVALASQGRAFDASRAWTEEELTALLGLEAEFDISRKEAAEYVRNGILTAAQYNKAVEVGIVPKSLETLRSEAIAANLEEVSVALGDVAEPAVVSEPEVVPEPEAEVAVEETAPEAEVVSEPEVVAEEAVLGGADDSKAAKSTKGSKK